MTMMPNIDPRMLEMIASAMSTGAPQGPSSIAPPMPSSLMSPQGLPDRDRHGLNTDAFLGVGEEILLGEMPLSPGDVRGIAKAFRGKNPWSMSQAEYHTANPHDPLAGKNAAERGKVFDELPDDSEVWVYHATSPQSADDFVANGIRQENKPWNLSREQYQQGVRGGNAGRFAPGKGLGEGFYVGSSPVGIEGYGRRILAIRTKKSRIGVPPEQEMMGKSPGYALSDSDAMIMGDISPEDVIDITPKDNGLRYKFGHEGMAGYAKEKGLQP